MRKVLFVALATLFISSFAFGATSGGTLTVNATVNQTCTISSPTLTFPAYDTLSASNDDSSVNFAVRCTKNASGVWIGLAEGSNAGGGSTAAAPIRNMLGADTTTLLGYQLYSDVAGGTVWGDTAGTGKAVAAPASHAAVNYTVFGRIPAGQDVTAQNYTDSVTATINF